MSGYFYTEKPSETDFSLVEKLYLLLNSLKKLRNMQSLLKRMCSSGLQLFTQDFNEQLNMQVFYKTIFLYCRHYLTKLS